MELRRRRPRLRPPRWLLGGLAALCGTTFLATGVHEELLSRALPLLLPRGERLAGPPPPAALLLMPAQDTCRPRAPFLLVLVASAPGHAARRAAVRETWGGARQAAGRGVRTLFALGLPAEPALQAALAEEAARHGDLLQGRFADTYANLTRKTLALLGWARAHCAGARFVAKADDDVFLNLPALARRLAGLDAPRAALYLGRVHWRVPPDRDPRSRHHVPAALYAPAAFPPYCSGTAYVLSGEAADAVLGAAALEPLVPLEDAFVGLCARRAGIAPRHVAALAGGAHYPPDPCCYRELLLSVHGVAPAAMRHVWLRPGPPCSALQWALGRLRCKALAWLAAL